ncbi:hypothetical protein K461DRAFT_21701 [Myriangium duriaei CBS 260.36]|uniref:N-acetyltransferase domain-containing protein n=1 Tax=Myriangium duriaei CBS 260.36 TaxID=1168546 RepID=A0A9P4MPU7_9PEZI|nr:hypothetical protein K461DRAFT_21701 [Myriangium duriaei CBS 260.36]
MATTTTTVTATVQLPSLAVENPILARKGPYILRRMLPRDVAAYERIMDAAFGDSMNAMIYPNGKSAADVAWNHDMLLKHMTRDAHYMTYLAVFDTSAPTPPEDLAHLSPDDREAARSEGRMAGHSAWKIHPRDRTQAELDAIAAEASGDGYPPSGHRALLDDFYAALGDAKKRHLGTKAHVLLHMLATDPDYHRRGIGSMQIRWGIEETDRLGVVSYLEASEDGKALYERYGYHEVEKLDFDCRKHIGGEEVAHTIMIRPAKTH